MNTLTVILLSVLVVLVFSHTIEGFTVYNWATPSLDDKPVKTEEVEVERSDKFPTGYAAIPILDSNPINLKEAADMLVDNRNMDNYTAVLGRLDDIEDKLIKNSSRYTCTNIYGRPEDNDDEDRVLYNCDDKILSYDALEEKCISRGCSDEECCVPRLPAQGMLYKFFGFAKKCVAISKDNNQPDDRDKIYLTEALCNDRNTPCSKVVDLKCPAKKKNIDKDFVFCDSKKKDDEDCIDKCCK